MYNDATRDVKLTVHYTQTVQLEQSEAWTQFLTSLVNPKSLANNFDKMLIKECMFSYHRYILQDWDLLNKL